MAWGCTEESLDYRKQRRLRRSLCRGTRFFACRQPVLFLSRERRRDALFRLPVGGIRRRSACRPLSCHCRQCCRAQRGGVTIRRKSMYCRTRMASMSASPKGWLTPRVWLSRKLWKFLTATLFESPLHLCSCIKHVRFMLEIGDFVPLSSCRGSFFGRFAFASLPFGTLFLRRCERAFYRRSRCGSSSFTADIYVLDLVPPRTDAPSHLLSLELVGEDGSTVYPVTADLTDAVRSIASEGGVFPNEISLRVVLSLIDGQLRASVLPWDEGSGGGVI